MKNINKKYAWFSVAGIILLFFGLKFSLAKNSPAVNSVAVPEVGSDVVQLTSICDTITFSGFADGQKQADVSAKVSGQIKSVTKKEGDRIRAGETILTIDGQTAFVGLQNNRRALDATQNSRNLASIYYDRLIKEAAAAKTTAKDSGDDNAYAQAKKAFESAKAAKSLQLSFLDAQIVAGNGSIASAITSLSDYTLTAPYGGTLVRLNVKAGDFTSPGLALFTLADASQLEIVSSVTTDDAKNITVGQSVTLTESEKKGTGKILTLSPAGDAISFKTLIRVLIDPEQPFHLGDFLQVQITPENITPLLSVSKEAILYRYDDAFVFLIDSDNTVHEKKVRLGQDCQERVVILNGLQVSDRVVTDGKNQLQNNKLIKIYGQ